MQSYDYDKKYRIVKERNTQLNYSGYEATYTYDSLDRVIQKETKNMQGTTIAKETAVYNDGVGSAYLKTTHWTIVNKIDTKRERLRGKALSKSDFFIDWS